MRSHWLAALLLMAIWLCPARAGFAQSSPTEEDRLPDTELLTIEEPLDEVMVAGIDRFALRALASSPEQRSELWRKNLEQSGEADLTGQRERLRTLIGAVDARVEPTGFEVIRPLGEETPLAETSDCTVDEVRWRVLDGVTGEGLMVTPKQAAVARVILLPDADWTPEMVVGLGGDSLPISGFPLLLAQHRIQVLIPALINRDYAYSRSPYASATNLPHREYIYRMSFELGRHIIGYEVQKALAAIDQFAQIDAEQEALPVGVAGYGEGGLLALYAAAIDPRIQTTLVSGYFEPRESVWEQPIYRNVWAQLTEFGDAELATMAAWPGSRRVIIEACAAPEISGPTTAGEGIRNVAAPGHIQTPRIDGVRREFSRAEDLLRSLTGPSGGKESGGLKLNAPGEGLSQPSGKTLHEAFVESPLEKDASKTSAPHVLRKSVTFESRQRRQVSELVDHTQTLLRRCAKVRDQLWADADRSSVAAWQSSMEKYRKMVYDELIGRLPRSSMPLNPRSRLAIDEEDYTAYDVVLDVYPDVIATGMLLLPKDLKPGERRPVVVCQHGLEGTPMNTITTDPREGYNAYKAFSVELVRRGFIVYAPQNPYRGRDRFRTLQRKSNPLKRSLFSYIIPQHERTLEWLSSLPSVDPERIGFYGLSYGGKTAVRVPPLVSQYALSICSADFNEWVVKNASAEDRYSYVFTGEYEIFEWNMGHVANYAELSSLMIPRPFMVERGHDDGVAPDEWVAWEYAKVRRNYNKLGIGERTEIEFFDGPHTINGQGTFAFLHRHLNWPETDGE